MNQRMGMLLIRHALNDWVGERLAGWTPGVHLNEQGRVQASGLTRRLAGTSLAAVYSSPLERAMETAHPLAEAHSLSVHVREGLGEAQYGDWTGRMLKELREDKLWPAVQGYPSGMRFPGGESFREVQARMVAELDAIRDAYPDQTVAVISHADPIKLAVAHYAGMPLDLFQRLTIDPASVTAFAFGPLGPRLICLNHTELLPSLKIEQKEQDREK